MLKEELNLFLHWIEERHRIFLVEKKGLQLPRSADAIFARHKFSNPFRKNDKETLELKKRLSHAHSTTELFKRIVVFRMFNSAQLYTRLCHARAIREYSSSAVDTAIQSHKKNTGSVFSRGCAYNIQNLNTPSDKEIRSACCTLKNVLAQADFIVDKIKTLQTLKAATTQLMVSTEADSFFCYNIVTDLRHTVMLRKATDAYTWTNPSNAARKGVDRILFGRGCGSLSEPQDVNYQNFIWTLMRETQLRLGKKHIFKDVLFEMQDIEYSLREFSRYVDLKMTKENAV